MEVIKVKTGKPYDIIVGKKLLKDIGTFISERLSPKTVAIITDDTVDKLYSQVVTNSLLEKSYSVVKFVFKAGEQSKNLTTYSKIIEFLAENNLTRTDCVIALGGGVVGDMAGFASATYLRGIKYIQVPTTLLSQIDSSVGGKTAVDLPQGKNLVGAFCQPALVVCDVSLLDDLPDAVFLDGMGELIKYALLDKDIFKELSTDKDMLKLVKASIDYKRKVVEEDEFEQGVRKFLNLGHTPCHSIEKLSDYTITHGRAVALGIKIMVGSALKKGYIDNSTYKTIMDVIDNTVKTETCPFSAKELAKNAIFDKKRSGDNITLVTVHGIGDCRLEVIKISDLEDLFTV